MGGGDWVQQVPPPQQLIPIPPPDSSVISAADMAYAFLKKFIPDWLIIISLIVGLVTIALALFRKQIKGVLRIWIGDLVKEEKINEIKEKE